VLTAGDYSPGLRCHTQETITVNTDIKDISSLFSMPTVASTSLVNTWGAQAMLLIFLYKLDVVGMRRLSYSAASTLLTSHVPPPCSIRLPVVNLSLEYLQFCHRKLSDEEFKKK
jgi:hypothetical protein